MSKLKNKVDELVVHNKRQGSMANSDKLLLETGGKTIASGSSRHISPPPQRQQKGSSSSKGIDLNEGNSSGVRPYINEEPSGSRVPPKRNMHMKVERAHALEELTKRRRNAANRGSSSRVSPVKERTSTALVLYNRMSAGEPQSDEGEYGTSDSDEDKMLVVAKEPTFEEIKEITIPRSKLIKWFREPFFEELMVGCFVLVNIGMSYSRTVYRLCEVRNVDATDPTRPYEFNNITTYKYLNLVWGRESAAARWKMGSVSNSPPRQEEFDQWFREVKFCFGRMPTKDEVLEKRAAIQKISSFVYSAAIVKQMLQEKRSTTWRPMNIAVEKEKLRRALLMAEQNDDAADIQSIKKRMSELDALRQAQRKDPKALKVEEINRRNRAENYKIELKGKLVDNNTSSRAGEVTCDPFTRRWNKPRNYYAGNYSRAEAAGTSKTNPDKNTASPAAVEDKLVDTTAPVDEGSELYKLHNFELSIPLDELDKYGGARGFGAGYMARKQKVEATQGVKVPDDGKTHAKAMSISEYWRRRQLE